MVALSSGDLAAQPVPEFVGNQQLGPAFPAPGQPAQRIEGVGIYYKRAEHLGKLGNEQLLSSYFYYRFTQMARVLLLF